MGISDSRFWNLFGGDIILCENRRDNPMVLWISDHKIGMDHRDNTNTTFVQTEMRFQFVPLWQTPFFHDIDFYKSREAHVIYNEPIEKTYCKFHVLCC